MLRIVICTDDSEKSRTIFELLQGVVKKLRTRIELSYVREASSVLEKLNADSTYYDVFIFDALAPECITIAQRVRNGNLSASFVFLVSKEAKTVFDIIKFRPSQAVVVYDDVVAMEKALSFCCHEQLHFRPYFTVKTKEAVMRVYHSDISYFESNQRKVTLHLPKRIIEFYGKLSDIIAMLPQDQFSKCHQSYIVNLSKVRHFDKVNRMFTLASGATVEISKSQYQQVVSQYEEYTARN